MTGARTLTVAALVVALASAAFVAGFLFARTGGGNTTTLSGGTAEYVFPTANMTSTISVKVGETFAIQLSSNADSTAYDWNVSPSGGVRYLNYTVVSTSNLIGGPQVRNYFFLALAAGSQTIVLQDKRSFAPYAVAATISIQVAVS
jgi:predicted secreted protein